MYTRVYYRQHRIFSMRLMFSSCRRLTNFAVVTIRLHKTVLPNTLTWMERFGYSLEMKEPGIQREEWEKLCNRCGLCCFEKIEDESGAVFFTSIPCRYLDVVTRECRIYRRRFEIYPECVELTEELVRELSWLHDDCGYRQALGLRRRQPGKRR